MKKIITLLFWGVLMASPAYAMTKTEKVDKLLSLMDFENNKVVDAVYEQAMTPVLCSLVMLPSEEYVLKEKFLQIMDFDSYLNKLIHFWVDNFTENEIDQLLAFYQSSVGQKSLRLIPQYLQSAMDEAEKWLASKTNDLEKFIEEINNQYRKRSGKEIKDCIKSRMGT